jgi:peptide/nickel transport system ATP-binding protein
MPTLLDLRSLTVELPTADGPVFPVNNVSFTLGQGESLGLVGESGSGKTMLALALVGLLPAGTRRSGEAWLSGANGAARNLVALDEAALTEVRGQGIGFVFQEPMTALNPVMRIGSQISEALRAHQPGLSRAALAKASLAALERARVPESAVRARQFPHQLSGGLRQRAMIAMALAAGPRLLVADEPTTALDVTVQREILELLARLRKELGLSLLFITHDLAVVAQVADRLAVMYAGRIVEIGPTHEVLQHPLHPYTAALLQASPRLKIQPKTLLAKTGFASIPGSVPSLDALPPGCAFAPRCIHWREECSAAVPELRADNLAHLARCILVAGDGCEMPEGRTTSRASPAKGGRAR